MPAAERTTPDTIIPCPAPRLSPEAGDAEYCPANATRLHCGGCGMSAVFEQDEHHYGWLVHSFLDRHARCGNAVQITRAVASHN
ncbi:MAG TPA: hypothetical protein VMV92_22410 [Streptosporangiaceae bacterium]|nr:hypothetical protein [Streptosporangiaceae bacterium]